MDSLTVDVNGGNIGNVITKSVGLVSWAVVGSYTSELDLVISDSNDVISRLNFHYKYILYKIILQRFQFHPFV